MGRFGFLGEEALELIVDDVEEFNILQLLTQALEEGLWGMKDFWCCCNSKFMNTHMKMAVVVVQSSYEGKLTSLAFVVLAKRVGSSLIFLIHDEQFKVFDRGWFVETLFILCFSYEHHFVMNGVQIFKQDVLGIFLGLLCVFEHHVLLDDVHHFDGDNLEFRLGLPLGHEQSMFFGKIVHLIEVLMVFVWFGVKATWKMLEGDDVLWCFVGDLGCLEIFGQEFGDCRMMGVTDLQPLPSGTTWDSLVFWTIFWVLVSLQEFLMLCWFFVYMPCWIFPEIVHVLEISSAWARLFTISRALDSLTKTTSLTGARAGAVWAGLDAGGDMLVPGQLAGKASRKRAWGTGWPRSCWGLLLRVDWGQLEECGMRVGSVCKDRVCLDGIYAWHKMDFRWMPAGTHKYLSSRLTWLKAWSQVTSVETRLGYAQLISGLVWATLGDAHVGFSLGLRLRIF